MSQLTPEEKKWVRGVQKALKNCPSKRIGFFTIGDDNVVLYDKDKFDQIPRHITDNADLVSLLDKYDLRLDDEVIYFPTNVEGVCG